MRDVDFAEYSARLPSLCDCGNSNGVDVERGDDQVRQAVEARVKLLSKNRVAQAPPPSAPPCPSATSSVEARCHLRILRVKMAT